MRADHRRSVDLVHCLACDLHRWHERKGIKGFLHTYLTSPGFRYVAHMRVCAAWRKSRSLPKRAAAILSRLALLRISHSYGFQIPPATKIGPGFYIGHFGTIIINPRAQIGRNVNVAPGVVIGQANRGAHRGVPVIGDRVWIGCNATVVGGIRIGDDALIAPGAYVNRDVPDKAVMLGNPAEIFSLQGSGGYVGRILQDADVVEMSLSTAG